VALHKFPNVSVNVQHKVDEKSYQFHGHPLRNYRCSASPKMPQ